MTGSEKKAVWFLTGSQDLYGEDTLRQVADNARLIVSGLNDSGAFPWQFIMQPVLTSPESILKMLTEADHSADCIGIVTWMHTFSPAKMWINGLRHLRKPLLHFHTQFNRDIPWDSIDMDYMNLHQSAHGGREYGFMLSRMRRERKVVVGHWQDRDAQSSIAKWMRAAAAWHDWQGMRVARFGDNMRQVAVTEGDKVEAELQFGYNVSGYGIGDLVKYVNEIEQPSISNHIELLQSEYDVASDLESDAPRRKNLEEAVRIELGMEKFLEDGGFSAFTTTFEDLHGISQLPGHAVQRLMAKGFGFGAEGDWKTAALVRAMKVMGHGMEGGTSFMEDYTYHFNPEGMMVLGAHMLEICPTIASSRPRLEVHPLGIGGKDDPLRLVFNVAKGRGINVSMMDMGNRFRMVVNPCEIVDPPHQLPELPVARVLWVPEPDLKTAASAWIHAGGAHHTGFSMAVDVEMMEDFARMAGVEFLLIDRETNLRNFQNEIRWNDMYYMLSDGLKK